MKHFNITGTCYPEQHYMVDFNNRIDHIKELVAGGQYLTLNRGRQFGKTTLYFNIVKNLRADYVMFSITFEGAAEEVFQTPDTLAYTIVEKMWKFIKRQPKNQDNETAKKIISDVMAKYTSEERMPFGIFSDFVSDLCDSCTKPVVLIIDEGDNAGNYDSFVSLLGMFRSSFLRRYEFPTFQSVILTGVYDIRNLTFKDRQFPNSPYNIATPFDMDMSFSPVEIKTMLDDYEKEHHSGMDTKIVAQYIHNYTDGYPFLVSKLCKSIDEQNLGWNVQGIDTAVTDLVNEKITLFTEFYNKMEEFPDLKTMVKKILNGEYFLFNVENKAVSLAASFNWIKNNHGKMKISNKIFEIWLKNTFVSEKNYV